MVFINVNKLILLSNMTIIFSRDIFIWREHR